MKKITPTQFLFLLALAALLLAACQPSTPSPSDFQHVQETQTAMVTSGTTTAIPTQTPTTTPVPTNLEAAISVINLIWSGQDLTIWESPDGRWFQQYANEEVHEYFNLINGCPLGSAGRAWSFDPATRTLSLYKSTVTEVHEGDIKIVECK